MHLATDECRNHDGRSEKQKHQARDKKALVYRQREPVAERANDDTPTGEGGMQGHRALTFLERTSQMSTGAPTKAVTMPTWISAGRMLKRPRISALSSTIGASSNV